MAPDEDPIDFTLLDPTRDVARWEARVSVVSARALRARRERRSMGRQISAWSPAALLCAAAAAVFAWTATPRTSAPVAGTSLTSTPSSTSSQDTPAVWSVLGWVASDQVPDLGSTLETVGRMHP